MAISRLLQVKPLTSEDLYQILITEPNADLHHDPLGLATPQNDKTTQEKIKAAFEIHDDGEKAIIKDAKRLHELALYFKQRRDHADSQPQRERYESQYALCLALYCHPQVTTRIFSRRTYPNSPIIKTFHIPLVGVTERLSALSELAVVYANRKAQKDIDIQNLITQRQTDQQKVKAPIPAAVGDEKAPAALEPAQQALSIKDILATMKSKISVNNIKKMKQEQSSYFKDALNNLNLEQLKELNTLMDNVQQNKTQCDAFNIIRTERYSLFGGGNTDTWQDMRKAVKAKIAKKFVDLYGGRKIDQATHESYATLFNQHSGRFYARWGQSDSLKKFKQQYPEHEIIPTHAMRKPGHN